MQPDRYICLQVLGCQPLACGVCTAFQPLHVGLNALPCLGQPSRLLQQVLVGVEDICHLQPQPPLVSLLLLPNAAQQSLDQRMSQESGTSQSSLIGWQARGCLPVLGGRTLLISALVAKRAAMRVNILPMATAASSSPPSLSTSGPHWLQTAQWVPSPGRDESVNILGGQVFHESLGHDDFMPSSRQRREPITERLDQGMRPAGVQRTRCSCLVGPCTPKNAALHLRT